jgi:hypothetical protein
LEEFIKSSSDESLKKYAENLLTSSKNFQASEEKGVSIRFTNILDGQHRFVIVYLTNEKAGMAISRFMETFNDQYYKANKLTINTLPFNDRYTMTYISELPDRNFSMGYLAKFIAQSTQSDALANFKFDTFVITKENFDIFYRTKALNEYLTFFDRNYKKENQ